MAKEKKQKPEEETKTSKPVRDKNGRFACKKPSEGKKGEGKPKPKEANLSAKSEKESPSEKGVTVSIVGVGTRSPLDIGEMLSDFFGPESKSADSAEDKESKPDEYHDGWQFPDGTLKVDGKIYIPQDKVAKLLSRTIAICAETASEYISQVKEIKRDVNPLKDGPCCDKEYEKKAKSHLIAQKLSKVAANIIMGILGVGVLSAAAFGLHNLYTLIFR